MTSIDMKQSLIVCSRVQWTRQTAVYSEVESNSLVSVIGMKNRRAQVLYSLAP